MDFIPSFSMALRLFFSLLLCFDLPLASPSCPEDENMTNTCQTQVLKLFHTPEIKQTANSKGTGKQEN